MDIWIWLGVAAVALIIELITNELLTLWIAIAGLVSAMLATFGLDWYISLIVFGALSVLLTVFLRKIAIKVLSEYQQNKTKK